LQTKKVEEKRTLDIAHFTDLDKLNLLMEVTF